MEDVLKSNKTFKQAIKKHELKQVCAWPMGYIIVRIYVTTKEATPKYYRSVWALDEGSLKITNTALSADEAQHTIKSTYVLEVRRLKLLGCAHELLERSKQIAAGHCLLPNTMDERKWHKLRADIVQFMLKDYRVYEESNK